MKSQSVNTLNTLNGYTEFIYSDKPKHKTEFTASDVQIELTLNDMIEIFNKNSLKQRPLKEIPLFHNNFNKVSTVNIVNTDSTDSKNASLLFLEDIRDAYPEEVKKEQKLFNELYLYAQNTDQHKDSFQTKRLYKKIEKKYMTKKSQTFSLLINDSHSQSFKKANEFQKQLVDVLSGIGLSPSQPIEVIDVAKLMSLLQHIEYFFLHFDKDNSGFIDYHEGMYSYERNKVIFKFISDVDGKQFRKAAYAYILRYGKLPKGLWQKVSFMLLWSWNEDLWEQIHADRMKVLKAFNKAL